MDDRAELTVTQSTVELESDTEGVSARWEVADGRTDPVTRTCLPAMTLVAPSAGPSCGNESAWHT